MLAPGVDSHSFAHTLVLCLAALHTVCTGIEHAAPGACAHLFIIDVYLHSLAGLKGNCREIGAQGDILDVLSLVLLEFNATLALVIVVGVNLIDIRAKFKALRHRAFVVGNSKELQLCTGCGALVHDSSLYTGRLDVEEQNFAVDGQCLGAEHHLIDLAGLHGEREVVLDGLVTIALYCGACSIALHVDPHIAVDLLYAALEQAEVERIGKQIVIGVVGHQLDDRKQLCCCDR